MIKIVKSYKRKRHYYNHVKERVNETLTDPCIYALPLALRAQHNYSDNLSKLNMLVAQRSGLLSSALELMWA